MKELEYDGYLTKDLKRIKKPKKKWDIILKNILIGGTIFLLSIPFAILFGKLFHLEINWAVTSISMLVWDVGVATKNIFRDVKERNAYVQNAESNINGLAYRINSLNRDSNNLVADVKANNIKDAIVTKDKKEKEEVINTIGDESGHIKKTTVESADFFLLDTKDQLRVLREIKESIKEDGYTHSSVNLYLLDEEDMPSYVPVVRSLERK